MRHPTDFFLGELSVNDLIGSRVPILMAIRLVVLEKPLSKSHPVHK